MDTTQFENCSFMNCEFGIIHCGKYTSMKLCKFTSGCTYEGIQSDNWSAYSEQEIIARLQGFGASVDVEVETSPTVQPKYDDGVINAVERLVKASLKTCDVSSSDFQDWCPDHAKQVLKAGLSSAVLKEIWKQSAGPGKQFFRIQVDKQLLLSARARPESDTSESRFWQLLLDD